MVTLVRRMALVEVTSKLLRIWMRRQSKLLMGHTGKAGIVRRMTID